MIPFLRRCLLILLLGALSAASHAAPARLVRHSQATQLEVGGKPFLVLGGELSNSASSSADYMAPIWPRLQSMGLNAVLAPISWQQLEPTENRFDYSQVDFLIDGARKHDLKLVLLWFGAWKNSMSTYVPSWVKRDQRRFPRAQLADGSSVEILSALSPQLLAADSRAFAALLAHLRQVDGDQDTVLMIQVENEIGMLPTARDHSAAANAAFAGPVPTELLRYLAAHQSALAPQLHEQRSSGTWQQVFGRSAATEEIFTAWTYARYVDALTRAGKRAYDLPMYVNAALNRPAAQPGDYPSGGPIPHLIDVWKAGAPSLDLIAPDIYFPDFSELVARYDRPDNVLFIPEAGRASIATLMADSLLAFGEHRAIGFSPFSVDTFGETEAATVRQAYAILALLEPAIAKGQSDGTIRAAKPPVAFDGSVDERPQELTLGSYRFTVSFIDPWTPRNRQHPEEHAALIIQTGPEDYLVAGTGAVLTFTGASAGPPLAGIDVDWEQKLENGRLVDMRLLNGDETHQGRHIRLPPGEFTVQRFRLYRFR